MGVDDLFKQIDLRIAFTELADSPDAADHGPSIR